MFVSIHAPARERCTGLRIGDTRVTLKHYAPFVKERQVRLEELVRASWK